jgi:hypothetical protein
MRATEVIETYIDDTVRLLPSRQRDDVATELRTLLNEELHARANEPGRAPDAALAVSLVRDYGEPNEVAARYRAPWAIIDPADTTSFMRASIIGAGALILFGAISQRVPYRPGTAEILTKFGILSWLGLLVLAFGAKSWIRRRWPAPVRWEPRDRDRANRVGTAVGVPIAMFSVVLYGAPTWVLGQLSGGQFDTTWSAYTADFQRLRLPCFIGLITGLIALLAFVAIEGRWRRLTRRINIGLNMALACLVLTFAVDGDIFQSSLADLIARKVLALVAAVYLMSVGVQVYGEIGRGDRTGVTKAVH